MNLVARPKVSVIMATYNRAIILPSAVNTILDQTLQNFELILINDASSDNTEQVLADLAKLDSRIRTFSNQQNLGNGPTRNIGLDSARGEYIAIVDDDDISLPNRLEVQSRFLDANPSADVVITSCYLIDNHLNVLGMEPQDIIEGTFPKEPHKVFEGLYTGSLGILNSSAMFRRSILEKTGGYGTTTTGPDRFLYLKISALGYKIVALPQPLIMVRRSEDYKDHVSQKRALVAENRVKNVQLIRQWLQKNGIKEFEHLHKLALSNALARQARHIRGLRGFGISLQALFFYPGNSYAQETFAGYVSSFRNRFSK